jgi:hypothetical protein
MRRRVIPILVVVVLVLAAAVFFVLRRAGPPEAARLLPDADAILYVDVATLRRGGVFSHMGAVTREPEYEDFVRQTGFQFERDLDETAFAVHAARPANAAAPRNPDADYPRYSEVFEGRFDTERVLRYFRPRSSGSEQYRGIEVLSIPHEGRTVRFAILGPNLATASNTESADAIHQIIDHHRRAALPFAGPPLLAGNYRRVPFATLAWLIARVAPDSASQSPTPAIGGIRISSLLGDLAAGSTVVGSLRFTGKIELKVEALAPDEAHARQIAENAGAWLNLLRALESGSETRGTDPDVKALFDSLRVEQQKDSVVLRAEFPPKLLEKIVTEPPTPVASPPPQPTKPAPPRSRVKQKK